MRTSVKWVVAGAVVVGLVVLGARVVGARRAQMELQKQQAVAANTEVPIELAPTDIVVVKTRELANALPVSGALKAVASAVIKARVAGELQDLRVREGDTVRAGQVLARVDATEYRSRLRQATEQADAAKAQIDISQRQYDNNKALVDQGFISRTALDTSLASLNSARSSYNAAMAAADVAKKSLDDTVLKSPIDGQVSQRLAQPGERVAIDGRVLEVVDLSKLELEASLSGADSVPVRVGQTATLSVEGRGEPVTARVVRVNPVAVAGSRSVLVYLGLDTTAGLRQGLFAQGTLDTGRTAQRTLPISAVRTDKPQPYVQTVENGHVVHRTVTLGARGVAEREPMVAVDGVPEGTRVLAGSVGLLRDTTAVKEGAASPAGAASAPAPSASAAR